MTDDAGSGLPGAEASQCADAADATGAAER